jgi:hypothetical protein
MRTAKTNLHLATSARLFPSRFHIARIAISPPPIMSVYVAPSHLSCHEHVVDEKTSSLERPLDYPAALLKERSRLPEFLYILVEGLDPSGIRARKARSSDDFTKQGIEAHLWHKFDDTVTTGLISAYKNEETALKYRPCPNLGNCKGPSGQAQLLTLSMKGLGPGWVTVSPGVHVPVWGQIGERDTPIANYPANLWICLEEARVVLGLEERLGARGEWLACGFMSAARVIKQVKLPSRQPEEEHMERVFDDQEKKETDKSARERRRIEDEREKEQIREVETAHANVERRDSSRSLKPSERPRIPVRKSSLMLRVPRPKEDHPFHKLAITTRDVRVSYTHADPERAASLMKYALMMSHGKRLEDETTWLQETPPKSGLSRASSTLTIDNGSRPEEEAEAESVVRRTSPRESQHRGSSDLDTIPEETGSMMTPSESSRPSSGQQAVNERLDSRHRHREVHYYAPSRGESDTQSIREDRSRNSRSAAPSPSRSMFESQHTRQAAPEQLGDLSIRARLSRNELLTELLEDDDSALAEYARLSLQDPGALEAERRLDNRASRRESHSDVERYRRIVARQKERERHDSASSLTSIRQPRNDRYEAQQHSAPASSSVYSSFHIPELSDFNDDVPHASVEYPPHPHELDRGRERERERGREEKIPTHSKHLPTQPDSHYQQTYSSLPPKHPARISSRSEPFLAKRKEWKEKGDQMRERLADLTKTKKRGKRDLWDRSSGESDLWGDAGRDGR